MKVLRYLYTVADSIAEPVRGSFDRNPRLGPGIVAGIGAYLLTQKAIEMTSKKTFSKDFQQSIVLDAVSKIISCSVGCGVFGLVSVALDPASSGGDCVKAAFMCGMLPFIGVEITFRVLQTTCDTLIGLALRYSPGKISRLS